MSLRYFCYKIANFEEYSKKNPEERLNYEIQLKARLCEKFQLAIFPTCALATVLVKIWQEKSKEQFFSLEFLCLYF